MRGRFYPLLQTESVNNLTDTRMWRSGCRIPIDGIFHPFLVTLCFPEFTRQKRSSSCSRKKIVLRKTLTCGTVVKSVLKFLTPRFVRNWTSIKNIILTVSYFSLFFGHPISGQILYFACNFLIQNTLIASSSCLSTLSLGKSEKKTSQLERLSDLKKIKNQICLRTFFREFKSQ